MHLKSKLVTLTEAAEIIGCPYSRLKRLHREGTVAMVRWTVGRQGRAMLFDFDTLKNAHDDSGYGATHKAKYGVPEDFLTVAEAAKKLGYSESHTYNLFDQGVLYGTEVRITTNKVKFVDPKSVAEFVYRHGQWKKRHAA